MNLPFSRWLTITFISASTLLWRVADFAGEAHAGSYHMTRVGLRIFGHEAEILQAILIVMVLTMFLLSLRRLLLSRGDASSS